MNLLFEIQEDGTFRPVLLEVADGVGLAHVVTTAAEALAFQEGLKTGVLTAKVGGIDGVRRILDEGEDEGTDEAEARGC